MYLNMAENKENNSEKENDSDQVPGKQFEEDLPASDGIDNILCRPCLKRDKGNLAVVFCKTCNEFQCKACSDIHGMFAFMENHELVEANEAESFQSSFDMKGLDKCEKHQKLLEFFCEDENKLCCSSCAIVYHRKCQSVVEIQSVAKESFSRSSEVMTNLQNIKAKAESSVKQTQEVVLQLGRDCKEILLKIKRMRDDVSKMLDDLEVFVATKLAAFQAETDMKLTNKLMTRRKLLADITNILESIDNVREIGTPSQQFIVEHIAQDQIDEFNTKVVEKCQDIEHVTVSFEFDKTLQLPPLPLSDYIPGQLLLHYSTPETSKVTSDEKPIITLKKITSIDLKQSGDDVMEPLYSGLDFLPDGRLVAVDNQNMKCFIFSKKLKQLGSYNLQHMPLGVVVASMDKLAITTALAYKMYFLSVSKSNVITLLKTVTVQTMYASICMMDAGNFVVGTFDDSRPARIVSLSGEEKDFSISLSSKKYPIGTSECTYIRKSNTFVLSDNKEHIIYIYDIATGTRLVVKDDQIKRPRGVAGGLSDCILVCSNGTNSIVQISPDGGIISSFKLDVTGPYRVCVSQTFLALSTNTRGNKSLQLYKIIQSSD